MGRKGDEAVKAPQAMRLYADNRTLEEIADILDISTTSLGRWKEKSRVPGEDLDGWDLARLKNRPLLARLEDLLEREVEYAEGCKPGSINPTAVDAMSKFGAIVNKLKADQRKEDERLLQARAAENQTADFDRAAVFLENLKYLVEKIREYAPAAIEHIAEHLPRITDDFKETLK